jgi:hypothetical protein
VATVGKITSVVGLVTLAVALVVGIRSVPDIKRYFKIRSM